MAITQEELQEIVSAVLSSIQTNSKTIEQLTPVTSLQDDDCLEIGGGKMVTVGVLKGIIKALSDTDIDSLTTAISKAGISSVSFERLDGTVCMQIETKDKRKFDAIIPMASEDTAGLISSTDFSKLRLLIDNNPIGGLEQQIASIAIYPFSGLIYDATEALSHRTDTVWYSVKERLFFHVDTSGTTISKHNAYHVGDTEIRGDILFRCGNALYTKGSDKQLKKFVDEEALADIIKETTASRPEVVTLSESRYEALAAAGELSDGVIYMTYEDDSE